MFTLSLGRCRVEERPFMAANALELTYKSWRKRRDVAASKPSSETTNDIRIDPLRFHVPRFRPSSPCLANWTRRWWIDWHRWLRVGRSFYRPVLNCYRKDSARICHKES